MRYYLQSEEDDSMSERENNDPKFIFKEEHDCFNKSIYNMELVSL